MSRRHISLVIAFVVAAGVAVCVPELAIAQDTGAPPPSSQGGSSMPPPPSSGGGSGGGMMTPPPSSQGGGGGEFRPPEMLGRPMEGGMNRPPGGAYQEEYRKQYEQEVKRQSEQRMREMQDRYSSPQSKGEFRPQGQPFMEGGKDNAQGRSFTGDSRSEGRPFEGDTEHIIEVEDNGPGIPPAAQERIFERFYRLDPARSRDTGGAGLGLSIVKHLMELHGGHVSVQSSPGSGSRFSISFPQAAS